MKCCKKAGQQHDLGPICRHPPALQTPAIETPNFCQAPVPFSIIKQKSSFLFTCVPNTLFLNTHIKKIQFNEGNFNGDTKQF